MFMSGMGKFKLKKLTKIVRNVARARAKIVRKVARAPVKIVRKVARAPLKVMKRSTLLPLNITKSVFKKASRKGAVLTAAPKQIIEPEIVAQPPEEIVEDAVQNEVVDNEQAPDWSNDEQTDNQLNESSFPYASGDPDGGEESLSGLGKSLFKRITVKNITKAANPLIVTKKLVVNPFRRSKTLRKTALIAGSAAALWYGIPAIGAALKKAPVAGAAAEGSFSPEPEYGDTTGAASGGLITSSVFDTAARAASIGGKLAAAIKRPKPASATGEPVTQESDGFISSLMTGKNFGLIGAAAGLAVVLYLMKGKRK